MKYIKVVWKHSNPDDPIWLYSELTDDLCEIRKVEVFANGAKGHADQVEEAGGTRLSIEPLPPLEQIASDPEFQLQEITGQEFEAIWADRRAK